MGQQTPGEAHRPSRAHAAFTTRGVMARLTEAGDLIVLEEQDRTRWNRSQIAEALPLVQEAFRREVGPFALQAAIAMQHCQAQRPEDTNWRQIVRLLRSARARATVAYRVVKPCSGPSPWPMAPSLRSSQHGSRATNGNC